MGKKPTKTQELTEHLQRLQAEFDNYRKRTEKEQEQQKIRLTEGLIKDILPVLDNFALALKHSNDAGTQMIHDQLITVLQEHGVQEIQTETFNPTLHEAVTTVKDPKKKDNTIIETLQHGYLLGERLLRPAKVSVVKN